MRCAKPEGEDAVTGELVAGEWNAGMGGCPMLHLQPSSGRTSPMLANPGCDPAPASQGHGELGLEKGHGCTAGVELGGHISLLEGLDLGV